MSKTKEPKVTLAGEAPIAPEKPAQPKEMQAMTKYEEEASEFFDANLADKALRANSSEFPSLDEPNLPHDREVLQNRAAPAVVTTDTGMGRVEGEPEKDPSATVVR